MRHAPWSRGVPDALLKLHHRRLVLALVRRSWTLCAVDLEDAGHLYGFVTFQLAPARLHWVYVKAAYQNVGLGTELLRAAFGEALGRDPILASHVSRSALLRPAALERLHIVYCPYLLMKDTPDADADADQAERPETFDGPDSPGP